MTDIEVIATDGVRQKRVIWISITTNGIYFDFVREGVDNHFAYHKDGNVFRTINGITEKTATFEPLDSIKGTKQIVGMGFSIDIVRKAIPEYKMKKLQNIIFTDVRTYGNKTHIGCNITLLEPKRYDLLAGMESSASEIHLYTRFIPWVVIKLY